MNPLKNFLQNNFFIYATGSMVISLGAAYIGLNLIKSRQKQQPSIQFALDDEKKGTRMKSREEIRLEAMVENALKSTRQENLDNAFHAHERFMLPGRDHGQDPLFLQKIEKRCDELMRKQEKRRKKKKRTLEQDMISEESEDKIQFWK